MTGLAEWLREQEEVYRPFFRSSSWPGVRQHIIGLLLVHGATCRGNLKGATRFVESLIGMYRIHRNTAFELPVEGWMKIRRAQRVALVEMLNVDIADADHIPEPEHALPDDLLVATLKGLLTAAPELDSLVASEAIANWLGEKENAIQMRFEVEELSGLQIILKEGDHGLSAVQAFWALVEAYERLDKTMAAETGSKFGAQLTFTDDYVIPTGIPSDRPNHIISHHIRVAQESDEGVYYAKARLYLACLDWYGQKTRQPQPLGSVAAAVSKECPARSALGA
ncbi:MAG: hypothetical protein Q7T82_14400 [Armatimonadota bacterium]|nr:hypothetical protein [Armatimonadota bacterium]